jgi:hypothetical protein
LVGRFFAGDIIDNTDAPSLASKEKEKAEEKFIGR